VSTQDLAWMRALMIALGIIAALATNSLVFPRYSRVLFLNQTSRTLRLLSQLYLLLVQGMFRNIYAFTPHDKQETLKLELQIRNTLHRSSSLLTTMNDELSLVPVGLNT
jgi:serine protease inhibitor ecotin